MIAASTITFAVVFGAFVLASLVLLFLTIRFVLQRAADARNQWLGDDDADAPGSERDGEDSEAEGGSWR